MINYQLVSQFFDDRAKFLSTNELHSVLYNDNDSDLVRQRHNYEMKIINKLLDLTQYNNVLDLGCGTGRLIELFPKINSYFGIDQNNYFIEYAKKKFNSKNIRFSCKNVLDVSNEEIENFDLCIISGLAMYLNDEDLKILFSKLRASNKSFTLIWRESIAINGRINLFNHFSHELNHHYQAIYRSSQEYTNLLKHLNFRIDYNNFLYPKNLWLRQNTTQYIMIATI